MFWKVGYFVRDFYDKHGPFEKVLDVGSRDINGSVRWYLENELKEKEFPKKFTGIDMMKGKGVDVVIDAHNLLQVFKPRTFDLITCCETLEHDLKFWLTVSVMRTLLKSGGWMVVTTPSINFFKHDFPHDYYRFTEDAYKNFIFKGFKNVKIELYSDKGDPNREKPNNTVLAYGQKP